MSGAPPATRAARGIVPGLLLAVLVALAARSLHRLLPAPVGSVVGEVVLAVLLGLAAANLLTLPAVTAPGIRFSFHTVLRTAIVLLGAGFSFLHAVAVGGRALLLIVGLIVLALAVAHALGRAAGVRGELATLIGVGTAVCGNSAISATAPVIGARDEDVAYAIGTNTFFGTLAVFAYPVLGHWLGLSDPVFGTWAGTAVNDTSQVVATGFAYSDAAGEVATVVKLTRNALMGAVIVALGFAYARRGATSHARTSLGRRLRQSVPGFVVGFLAAALLNTLGAFERLATLSGLDVASAIRDLARGLILVALAGVGLGTRIDQMRSVGLRPFYVGMVTALCTSVASLLAIRLLGPAAP